MRRTAIWHVLTMIGLLSTPSIVARAANPEATAMDVAAASSRVGTRAAQAYLRNAALMMYRVDPVVAVHYADVASAYGAMKLAHATGDKVLRDAVRARYRRLASEQIPNSANHVDANVVGVWHFEMAQAFGDKGALAAGLALADGQWATVSGDGLTSQARFWIDDVWMIGALQITAWRATHEQRFLDRAALMAVRYLARLQEGNGLFHHGPEAPFFWGRGNGWVAAGLAEILSELPRNHRDYPAILAGYRRMMAALLAYQAPDGMWRQLIDQPDAWGETSGTAMFGYAMAVGVHHKLLDRASYAPAYRKAWTALASHVGEDGRLSDICVGTGQSRDAAYYLARPRTTGDLHGQAALLWFAGELAAMEKHR